jgi:hypothetical protein
MNCLTPKAVGMHELLFNHPALVQGAASHELVSIDNLYNSFYYRSVTRWLLAALLAFFSMTRKLFIEAVCKKSLSTPTAA